MAIRLTVSSVKVGHAAARAPRVNSPPPFNKKHNPRELECAINARFEQCLGAAAVYEDDYYQVKGSKDGDMHIEFKRADLLEKANKIIHDCYEGAALARGRRE